MVRDNSAIDVDRMIALYAEFKSRIALISIDGEESGTGFLVADKLLLTAQHVVEASAGIMADPRSIQVTFDFWLQPHRTYAETGDTVPVVEVALRSPPTDNERSAARNVDWEAPKQFLDYAVLRLKRPALTWTDGQLRHRGHYPIHSTPYRIRREQVLVLGHHPHGETLKSSFLTIPELNRNKTRIKYQADTMRGSSGGAIVNNRGRLVGLHHYASKTDKHGVPITAVAQDLEARGFGYLIEPESEQNVTAIGRYSANAKRQICQAIATDWQSLTEYFGVPNSVTSAYALWDWLSATNKLRVLREALLTVERTELVQILDDDVIIVDQSTIDRLNDLTEQLVDLAEHAATPQRYLRSAAGTRIVADYLLKEIDYLLNTPDDERAQLQWQIDWKSELGNAADSLEDLLPLLPQDSTQAFFTRPHFGDIIMAVHDVQSTIATLVELGQAPILLS